jgi:hypothetical protein
MFLLFSKEPRVPHFDTHRCLSLHLEEVDFEKIFLIFFTAFLQIFEGIFAKMPVTKI